MTPATAILRDGYRTAYHQRTKAKRRRDELRAARKCINAPGHGPATHGVLCKACRETHRRSASSV